jgi:nucleotide-binding universal stress UspA family protein
MAYRTILADLSADDAAEPCLRLARALAARFDAALFGMHVMPEPFVPTAWQGGASVYLDPEVSEAQRRANLRMKERVQASFQRVCGEGPDVTWREAQGDPSELIVRAARASDLVVTAKGQPGALDPGGVLEALVMTAGVPVLVLPASAPDDVGQTVLVAWNGSREAARAVHGALPMLAKAGHVVLCGIGPDAATDLEPVAAMLGRHGIKVESEARPEPDRAAGEVLLDRARAHGADLVVMGAYGHTRLRELIFGGATRHVLREAALPVLFGG